MQWKQLFSNYNFSKIDHSLDVLIFILGYGAIVYVSIIDLTRIKEGVMAGLAVSMGLFAIFLFWAFSESIRKKEAQIKKESWNYVIKTFEALIKKLKNSNINKKNQVGLEFLEHIELIKGLRSLEVRETAGQGLVFVAISVLLFLIDIFFGPYIVGHFSIIFFFGLLTLLVGVLMLKRILISMICFNIELD